MQEKSFDDLDNVINMGSSPYLLPFKSPLARKELSLS